MDDWQHALTAQVAQNIEHFRHLRRLTRTQLAERCTMLGLPTKRPALTALLDRRRQTITLQEVVVLAEALNTSVAELVLPLHTGAPAVSGAGRYENAFSAAQRLFAVPDQIDADGPYRLYLRFHRARRRFEGANRRLAELSHRIADGDINASIDGGRPHPASEILAAEAALSRLLAAVDALATAETARPPLPTPWDFLDSAAAAHELPLLAVIPERATLVPLYVYRLAAEQLPEPRLISTAPC